MNTYIRGFVALGSVAVLGLLASGCYTQFGSVQEDLSENAVDEGTFAYEDSTSAEDFENARRQFYYDYYYPPVTVGIGFAYPWHSGFYPAYGFGCYSPWLDPWYGWCGSAYPAYYAYWHYPYWGYSPYYGHGGVYYGNNGGYVDQGSRPYGGTRTFGSTRTPGSTRSAEVLPVGARSSTPVRKTSSSQPPPGGVSTGRRGQAGERQSVAGTRSDGQRPGSPSGRRETSRSEAPRWYPGASVSERPERGAPSMTPAQGYGSPGRESGRGGSDRSGGGSTYSPPPSAPPSSGNSGGSASANTGARGGNHR